MKTSCLKIMFLTIAVVAVSILPCKAAENQQEDEKSIWIEGEMGERGGPPPPEEPGEIRERRGPRSRSKRFELSEEEIERIMKSLKKSDPEKAKKLEELRNDDPNKFIFELGMYGGEEFGKVMRERIERWRNQRRDKFLEWLQNNYSQEAKGLAGLKEKDTELYLEKSENVRRKYWHIFEEEERNPELANVLKEDLELKERRDELVAQIKGTKNEREKEALAEDLQEVVGRRYDLIIRRKQIEYERLLKRVQELQKRLEESKAEIAEWRNESFKRENVKNRVEELTGGGLFKWD